MDLGWEAHESWPWSRTRPIARVIIAISLRTLQVVNVTDLGGCIRRGESSEIRATHDSYTVQVYESRRFREV